VSAAIHAAFRILREFTLQEVSMPVADATPIGQRLPKRVIE